MGANRLDYLSKEGCYFPQTGEDSLLRAAYGQLGERPSVTFWAAEHLWICDPERKRPDPADFLVTIPVSQITDKIAQNIRIAAIETHSEWLKAQLAETSSELMDCRERLEFIESLLPMLAQRPDYFEVADAIPKVQQITRDIFNGSFTQSAMNDTETADHYIEFRVLDNDDNRAVLARNDAWHRRVCALSASLRGVFRLSIESDD